MTGNPEQYDCDKCGSAVSEGHAVALTDGGTIWKLLCPDCLHQIGTPQDYDLIRDVSRDHD